VAIYITWCVNFGVNRTHKSATLRPRTGQPAGHRSHGWTDGIVGRGRGEERGAEGGPNSWEMDLTCPDGRLQNNVPRGPPWSSYGAASIPFDIATLSRLGLLAIPTCPGNWKLGEFGQGSRVKYSKKWQKDRKVGKMKIGDNTTKL